MEPETQITFPIPTENAAADADAPTTTIPNYPLDQQFIHVPVKKGIIAGEAQFATITMRRPLEKELIEREKKSRAGLAQVSKFEQALEAGDDSADLELATKLVTAIAGFNMRDGQPLEATRSVGLDNVGKIPATLRLAGLKGLYASICDVYTLDLENGVAVIKQELGTRNEPDYVIFHTLDISDEKLRTSYKVKTQTVMVNSKDPRIQRQSVRLNLAKIVEFYNTYFISIEGVSIADQPYTESQRPQALTLIDAYWKRQVMTTLTTALEDGLQD